VNFNLKYVIFAKSRHTDFEVKQSADGGPSGPTTNASGNFLVPAVQVRVKIIINRSITHTSFRKYQNPFPQSLPTQSLRIMYVKPTAVNMLFNSLPSDRWLNRALPVHPLMRTTTNHPRYSNSLVRFSRNAKRRLRFPTSTPLLICFAKLWIGDPQNIPFGQIH
jgi:hypothetical protein